MPLRYLSVAILFAMSTVPASTTRRTAATDLADDLEKVAASVRPGTSGETDGIRAAHNDNAIVVLPGNSGHLVIAAFLKGARGPESARDATLEQVARAAYQWASSRR